MRHRLAPLILVAGLALAVAASPGAGVARAEDGGTTKEFPDKNFSLTVPKGWTVTDASEEDQKAGFVCTADRPVGPSVYVRAFYLVTNAGNTTLAGFLDQLKELKLKKLEAPDLLGPKTVTWGGTTDAKYLRIVGTTGGSKVVSRVYAALVAGQYHQLELRAYNRADEKVSDEMDAVAEGYKFLKGANTTPAPPPDPNAKPEGGGSAGPGSLGADGQSMRFDAYALTWTLPKPPKAGDPPAWTFSPRAAGHPGTASGGLFAGGSTPLAVAVLSGLKADAALRISLSAGKAKPGFFPSAFVSNEENYQDLMRTLFTGTPAPSVDQEVALGNWRGASRSYAGTGQDGKPLYVRGILAALKGNAYTIEVTGEGGGDKNHLEDVKRALAGLAWDDVNEGVRGPWAAPFPSVTEDRPDWLDLGKETTKKSTVLSVKKPAAFGQLKFSPSDGGFANWQFGFEARKPDAYLFVGIQTYSYEYLQRAVPPREPDMLIDEFESTWKSAMGEPKTLTQRSGKANKSAASIAGGNGSTYRFEGVADGRPFVELGWVVRKTKNVIWVRAQFGGKDAETTLAPEWKALQRTIRIE